MGAHLDGAEAAVGLALAVVGAVGDGALDGLVGGAVSIGTAVHHVSPPEIKCWGLPWIVWPGRPILSPELFFRRPFFFMFKSGVSTNPH